MVNSVILPSKKIYHKIRSNYRKAIALFELFLNSDDSLSLADKTGPKKRIRILSFFISSSYLIGIIVFHD